MDMNLAVVVNEAQLAKLVHKRIYSRAGGTDHFRKHRLAYLCLDGLRFSLCAEIREEKKLSCEALFARVEKLIDQISLYACGPFQLVQNEELGELSLFVDHPLDGR